MIAQSVVYPPSPSISHPAASEISVRFKREVTKVLTSIVLFFIVYLLLVLLAGILALLTVYGGAMLIIAAPKFLTLMVGLGLIGVGVMVLIFLVKFIFAVSRFDHSNSIELKEADQPELFAFIRKLSADTQTSFPKKIFLTPEVNASVFYNSTFWSMFLPVRKNLQIGLGLVNVLTISEFKAVVAHEFGHFSQKSMKLGSFVYNVNKIIYNMLYHNSGYGRTLNAWANIHTFFALFASLTVRIVQVIQWVLQKMYALLNKNYMALSREMEFHADAVAAGVSGSNSLITALRKLELADSSYQAVVHKYNELFREKIIASNLYHDQQTVLHQIASENKLEIRNNMAIVSEVFLNGQAQNRVNIKDQWASHPSLRERTSQLSELGIVSKENNDPAWLLFRNCEVVQAALTKKIYTGISLPEDAVNIDSVAFREKFMTDQKRYRLPAVFKGYFDDREFTEFDFAPIIAARKETNLETEAANLISDSDARLPKIIKGLKSDISILEHIRDSVPQIKSFDFDGQKYSADQATEVLERLSKELITAEEQVRQKDKNIWTGWWLAANTNRETADLFLKGWKDYMMLRKEVADFLVHINSTLELIAPFYSDESLTHETVNAIIEELKLQHEPEFKFKLKRWLDECDFNGQESLYEQAVAFISKDYLYFANGEFMNSELDEYNQLSREIWEVVSLHKISCFKKLLISAAARSSPQ
jgi:Zn-dependent protease with chaperone function